MNSPRTVEMYISRSNVVDQVASFLYSIGVFKEFGLQQEEIINIEFDGINKDIVPIKVTFKEGVEIRKF